MILALNSMIIYITLLFLFLITIVFFILLFYFSRSLLANTLVLTSLSHFFFIASTFIGFLQLDFFLVLEFYSLFFTSLIALTLIILLTTNNEKIQL